MSIIHHCTCPNKPKSPSLASFASFYKTCEIHRKFGTSLLGMTFRKNKSEAHLLFIFLAGLFCLLAHVLKMGHHGNFRIMWDLPCNWPKKDIKTNSTYEWQHTSKVTGGSSGSLIPTSSSPLPPADRGLDILDIVNILNIFNILNIVGFCRFCSNRILLYFPLSSVRMYVRNRRDISLFHNFLMI